MTAPYGQIRVLQYQSVREGKGRNHRSPSGTLTLEISSKNCVQSISLTLNDLNNDFLLCVIVVPMSFDLELSQSTVKVKAYNCRAYII